MQFGDHFFCFSVFFFPCKSRTGTEHISQIMRLLVKLISQMRLSVFPPLFNMQRVVFIKEKQQTLRAISPPLLRTLTHRLNWASLRRTHSRVILLDP